MTSDSGDDGFVLAGGCTWTPGWDEPREAAVGIAAGRIAVVGPLDQVRREMGSPEIIDITGCLAVPGFHDAHVHAAAGGLDRLRCDLTTGNALSDYQRIIETTCASLPSDGWLVGSGWSLAVLASHKRPIELLDRFANARPSFLVDNGHHTAWVNSEAMRRAGIGRATVEHPGGRIERDESGEPTGLLHEGAMSFVDKVVPGVNATLRRAGLQEAQSYLHSLGIVSWQEAIVGQYPGIPDCLDDYVACDVAGELTARVRGSLWWDWERGIEQLDDLLERRARGTTQNFAPGAVKLMVDGVCGTCTAAVSEPYRVSPLGQADHGIVHIDEGTLASAVPALEERLFQLHFHAIGDRAVRLALDALEQSSHPARGSLRHHIAHLQLVQEAEISRLAAADVVANCQPLWGHRDASVEAQDIPHLGEDRVGRMFPLKAFQDAGAAIAFGSDWPVSSPNPLFGIHVAVNRVGPGDEVGGPSLLGPSERLDLCSAFSAYTRSSALVNHLDDSGLLEPGFRADVAVIEPDPWKLPAASIFRARVTATFAAGRLVFGAST